MATDAMPGSGSVASGRSLDLADIAYRAVSVIASLRVTVVLFSLAIIIIFVGTLAQVEKDMWQVIAEYFHAWVSKIELRVLVGPFFPSLLPWIDKLPVRSMIFPGGATIGLCMFFNLLAAHAIRFKVQARGSRLVWGLVITAIGAFFTYLVIEGGNSRDGLQDDPLVSWANLWVAIKVSLVAIWLASAYSLFTLGSERKLERAGMLVVTVILGAVLALLVYRSDLTLGNSSLRILWQMLQGGLAAVVMLVGCILIFKKRGGVVLLHAGVGLMMFGELFVSLYAEEAQMTILEGQRVNFARDIRTVELAVVDKSHPDHDKVVVIPRAILVAAHRDGKPIDDEQLPFRVEVLKYYRNSDIRKPKPEEENPATVGLGKTYIAEEVRAGTGTDGGEVDMASAYLKLTDKKTNAELGTYLLSVIMAAQDYAETIPVGDEEFELYLRFKRNYKPYTIQLVDVRKDDYLGTNTPRNYSSDVRVVDASRDIDREVHIWMNNPMRFAGETFYQSGYQMTRSGGELTTLQVVSNTGWMIPYISCMIVIVGMLAHFTITLLRFLSRRGRETPSVVATLQDLDRPTPSAPPARGRGDQRPGAEDDSSGENPSTMVSSAKFWLQWGVPVAIVLFCSIWLAGKMRSPGASEDGYDLHEFARLPVVYQGRVKPMDTLARNALQIISDRQEFKDADDHSQPAVRWLLDVISDSDAALEHKVFRITNFDVLKMMGLSRRKGFRYGIKEFGDKLNVLQAEAKKARDKPPEQLSVYDRKLLELENRVRTFRVLQDSFRPMPFPPFPTEEQFQADREKTTQSLVMIRRMMQSVPEADRLLLAMHPPRAVPVLKPKSEDEAWLPYATAVNTAYVQGEVLGNPINKPTLGMQRMLFAYATGEKKEFNRAVEDYRELLAQEEPEGLNTKKTDFETFFNNFAPFYHAAALYLIAFVLSFVSWLVGKSLRRAAFWLIVLTLAVHTFALVARIYISGRPPVTNLYSSAVFIGWGCVVLGLVLEVVFRIGVGNVVASIAGFKTLIIAHYLSASGDTFTVLQAVLDTQFWLATHVTCITLGYSTTFLAGLLGFLYLLVNRVCAWTRTPLTNDVKLMGGMLYGTICFAIFFSFFGTVLGGLWADDSWGRFWGWDPKENGALMIVLWNALILHARWGGLVKDRGVAVLAVLGNVVTAWSWFGVNELGVGLHSYGFTDGVMLALGIFALSQFAIAAFGLLPGTPPPTTTKPAT